MNFLQIQNTNKNLVNQNETLIFNEIIQSEGNILYDSLTGIISINEPGEYAIDWLISTQFLESNLAINFRLVTSENINFISNSPLKTGNLNGFAIINVTQIPATLYIENFSTSPVYLSSITNIKSSLRIFNINSAPQEQICFSRLQLVNLITQLIELYPNRTVRVFCPPIGTVDGSLVSLFNTLANNQVILNMTSSQMEMSINLDSITGIELIEDNYNNQITYLNFPTSGYTNCESDVVLGFYEYFNEAPSDRLFYINTSENISSAGTVLTNQYGMVVISQDGSTEPTFIVTKNITSLFYELN